MSGHKIRIYWIRHGFSEANMYKELSKSETNVIEQLGKKYQQSATLDPHLTNYARWYSILAGEHLVKQLGAKPISCVYSSYMKRATETAVWMFWNSGCRQFCQLPYISEQNKKIIGLVGPYLNIGADNRIDLNDSSVVVPTYYTCNRQSKKRRIWLNNKRSRSQQGGGTKRKSRSRSQQGGGTKRKSRSRSQQGVDISRLVDTTGTVSEETVPDWDAFQAFMANNYQTLNPSFYNGDVRCFIIVSHSHFLKAHVDAITDKIKNNECYMVEYTIDSKTLVDTKIFKHFPLRQDVYSDLNAKEINIKEEEDKKSAEPHRLLQRYLPETKVTTTTCSVKTQRT